MCNNSILTLSIPSEGKSSQIKGLSITRLLLPSQTPTVIPGHSYCWMTNYNLCCCSVTVLCLTLCDPIDQSQPGFPLLHYLSEFAQSHAHWLCDAIQPSCLLSSPSPPTFNLSQHQGLFQWVTSSHQVSKALELQLQYQFFMNIQGSFPLGWTGLISVQSKGPSRVFSNTSVQKHQIFCTQPSLWSNSHTHTWLLEKPQLWLDRPLSAK